MPSQQPFISRPMSILLDAVRGLAALLVLMGHMVQLELYTGPFPFNQQMQHNAVIVFFVLSGLVIAHSTRRGPGTLRDYAIARAARILPVSIFAVIFSTLVFAYADSAGMADQMPPPFNQANAENVLLPLFLLSESAWGTGLVWNPPFWSLCYEVWYYALFGAAIFLRGHARILCLALLALVAGWKILLMFPIWLMGAAIVHLGDRFRPDLRSAPFLLFPGLLLFVIADAFCVEGARVLSSILGVSRTDLGFSQFALTDTVIGLGISLVFLGLRPVADYRSVLLERLAPRIRWLADCSFTLYALHWPFLLVIRGHGISAGGNPVIFLSYVAVVVALAAVVAKAIEHRSPQLRALLQTRLSPRAAAA